MRLICRFKFVILLEEGLYSDIKTINGRNNVRFEIDYQATSFSG